MAFRVGAAGDEKIPTPSLRGFLLMPILSKGQAVVSGILLHVDNKPLSNSVLTIC
jgi:hypothetical protein